MQFVPYLNFNGRCKEAFEFYEKTLGGRIEAMFTHRETPASAFVSAECQDLIMHARLSVGNAVLMGSDSPPEIFQAMQGMSVSLHLPDTAEAERIFAALEEGGSVMMPIQETFWAARFGMVTDRFGTPWMINCEAAASS
jgi:PhnB protein